MRTHRKRRKGHHWHGDGDRHGEGEDRIPGCPAHPSAPPCRESWRRKLSHQADTGLTRPAGTLRERYFRKVQATRLGSIRPTKNARSRCQAHRSQTAARGLFCDVAIFARSPEWDRGWRGRIGPARSRHEGRCGNVNNCFRLSIKLYRLEWSVVERRVNPLNERSGSGGMAPRTSPKFQRSARPARVYQTRANGKPRRAS